MFSLLSPPPPGGLFFSGHFKGWGAYWRGGDFFCFLRKLYANFPPAQRNVCKTTMYSNNFNTTIYFFNYSTKYMF